MRNFAKSPENDRKDLFRETSRVMQIHESIIEKDFWVCWVLDYLFQESKWKDEIIFKGGTSLSKAYGAIQRFSEDVDLILDWSLLGYSIEEAFKDRSNKKQAAFGDEVGRQTIRFLNVAFIPSIQRDLRDRLGGSIAVTQDAQSVFIEFPQSFRNESIRREIILELGPKALTVPNEQKEVRSYASEQFSKYFMIPCTTVRTVNAERTFWEKATILHQEAHRAASKQPPLRYSRHYYDLYRLSQTPILDRAFARIDLLQDVALFKMKFFRSAWAKYDEAKPGALRLLPSKNHIDELRRDYLSMQAMLFGVIPSFDEILEGLNSLEKKINTLSNCKD